MAYLRQFFIILAISFTGEALNALIPLPIPASIYGLVLMLLALCSRVVKLEDVEDAGGFLTDIMTVMFIPAAVGILGALDVIAKMWLPIVAAIVVVTMLVIFCTGHAAQGIMRLQSRRR